MNLGKWQILFWSPFEKHYDSGDITELVEGRTKPEPSGLAFLFPQFYIKRNYCYGIYKFVAMIGYLDIRLFSKERKTNETKT